MLFDNIEMFKIPGSDFKNTRTTKFLTPEEGFLRGNMSKDEYEPYKNLTYFKLKSENERDALLLKLMAYSFAINDLNLYLDLHPNDMETFALFKKYLKEKCDVEDKFTSTYGPMTITETEGEKFNWIDNPWPWDKTGGSKYV